ncbi:putative DNA modification/repair radical SAM protein [Arcticibacter pallidicorallinus]|uniref:Putative DNA modification/repair radical SAM protein n=1 Tax=Arcticibacter pallidicorallinus TaxID=1259464 RepID=A0A2T0U526_9SPHI|nr:putative DNA modification/repair radical SAM protein [Arcticibacter pallidicorallinus]PRY53023.1 putative DNA modification/repair radical SAM protein [Arcticibacter pallidicorallinus]
MSERVREKLRILADAAKYDVSCASSGSTRKNKNKGLGDTGSGICHTYTADGRCVSLLKILLTNFCIYDCAYCVTRKSNDIERTAFTVKEVVDLTINFYRRNYIEGLFLSSGIFKNADYTMERLVRVAKELRQQHKFNGYIHLKTIPGASDELMKEAGLYADRLSVNIEIPTESGLKLLAPDKDRQDMIRPMNYLKNEIIQNKEERKLFKKSPLFVPAGQSSQMIIGATRETDKDIMYTADSMYRNFSLKRVYYSGYVPISNDSRLPMLNTAVPMVRENRLYQADWLMRFYGFNVRELLNPATPHLDLDIDPKLGWALRNLDKFPIDINKADLQLILRVPGIGVPSAQKIVSARIYQRLNWDHLKKLGVALNRARFFITCSSREFERRNLSANQIKQYILSTSASKYLKSQPAQLELFT